MTPNPFPRHRSTAGLAGRARSTAVAAAVATALGVFVAPDALSQTASASDLQTLKDQVQQLQRKIDELQRQQQAQAQAQAQQAQTAPATAAAPAAAPSSGPFFMAGPVKVTLGGFVELLVVNRNRNEAADWASNYNTSIPFPNSHNYDLNEFHLTERQSRVQALAQGPDSETYATEAYVESDFGAAPSTGNNNESTSFSPRVRHFYADVTYKPAGLTLLFGQAWSLVTGNKQGIVARGENIPLTIDGQYVPGFDWLRVPQVRLVEKFSDEVTVALSAENPAALVTSGASSGAPALSSMFNTVGAGNAFAPTVNITTDYLPDFVLKAAFDPGWGHYEVFGTQRFFRSRNITPFAQGNVYHSGTGFGGNMILPLVPKVLDFQASILAGRGVGRYGSAQLPDATVNPSDLGLEPLRGFQALVGLVARPQPDLTFYAYAGEEQVSGQSYFVTKGGKSYGYGYGNVLFDNSGCEQEGGTACAANTSRIASGTLGGWYKFYQGSLGNAQIGLSDTYIQRQIFGAIKGGDPNTDINIMMVSFRYYPYQK
ncbi:MAG TPA: hypothetical protein VLX90_21380 [Steroidobacteraceae bacterium]|nr:hypothetical protein [Steroidobacteraceae bacterium]